MPYIGRPIGVAGHTTQKLDDPASISGNAFTMKVATVAISPDAASLQIYVDGVRQEAGVAYTVSGSTLTFTGTFTSSNDFQGYVMGDAMYIQTNSVDSDHYVDGSIDNAHLADMAANTVKVRDANSSGVPSDKAVADTQLLIGDGTGFTAAALSGDVTMANTGAVTIANTAVENAMMADDAVDEASLKISNAGSNDQFLQKQSGNAGGLTWATVSTFDPDGAATFNDTGAAVDFRIESDDNANMFFVDGSEDRVGIGTASPAGKLEVAGSGHTILLTDSGDSYNKRVEIGESAGNGGYIDIFNDAEGSKVKFRSYGISYFTGGNVGIGTESPDSTLVVRKDEVNSSTTIRTDQAASAIIIDSDFTSDNILPGIAWNTADNNDGKPKAAIWVSSGASISDLTIGCSNAYGTGVTSRTFTVSGNDRVGIGTVGPSSKLDVEAAGANASTFNSEDFVCQIKQSGSTSEAGGFVIYNEGGAVSDHMFAMRGSDYDVRFSQDGNGWWDGAADNGAADYAEYFETNGEVIPIGNTVVLEDGKIRQAEDGETPLGVVRPHDGVALVGNSAWSKWDSKYMKDDYGKKIWEEYSRTDWTDEEGDVHWYPTEEIPDDVTVPDDAVVSTHIRKKLNPDFDDSVEYIPREDRDEWHIVGLLGQIPMTKGQPVADNWIKMKDVSDTVEMWFVK